MISIFNCNIKAEKKVDEVENRSDKYRKKCFGRVRLRRPKRDDSNSRKI